MWEAERRAVRLRAVYGVAGPIDDRDLDAIVAAAGLVVEGGWPFVGRVREVYAVGRLGIRRGLSPEWVRWLKGHGLGHHLLHRGNHLYVRGGLHIWRRHEVEAELFAGTLLLPSVVDPGVGFTELGRRARVPAECVLSWQAALACAHQVEWSNQVGAGIRAETIAAARSV
jgi:hypothetical protein